jgi:glycosyltransferase involved in cell wall biosynthesis
MTRIDFVITELFVGGAERCLTELALGMAQAGDAVRVFSLGSLPQGPQGLLVGRLESAGIPVASADADSPRQFPRACRQLRDWFAHSRPDISQSFLYHANVLSGFAASAAAVSVRVAGLRVAEPKWWRCRIERAALRRVHSTVCVSRAVQRFAVDRLGCSDACSVVIPNGVDVSRFAAAAPLDWSAIGWPSDSIVSLFVGRLHPQKGIELLQQQIDTIAPAGSSRRLLLVGDGPLRVELARWADRVGAGRVRLLPWQADVAPLMRACRLLVLPSHYEGMPNVVLEAMAAARPVVCSRVEGSDELWSDAAAEQSFAAGDTAAMKQLLEAFLCDPDHSQRVGRANQARVQAEFSISAMVDAYRSHYRMLLARRLDDPSSEGNGSREIGCKSPAS